MVLAYLLSAAWTPAAAPWHHPLSLDGQGYWPERVPVTLRNESDRAVAGEPVEVAIPSLAGAPVESLRACRADGVELLFDLRDAHGRARRSGLLAADDRLVLPAECPANGTATLYVYAGNREAWPVPDFLRGQFSNGGFELGGESPEDWMPEGGDARHRLAWEKSDGREGGRCARVEVDPGAPATWVQWQQSGLAVVPGRVYELRGWVRARDVAGSAGWYVHVNGESGELVNQTLDAGQGTFDWKQVSVSFLAPTNARTAVIGTVLHGTGVAWFDDAEWVARDAPSALRVSVGEKERLQLREPNPAGAPTATAKQDGAEVCVRNFSALAASPALVRVSLASVRARLPGLPRAAAPRVLASDGTEKGGAPLCLGPDLLFAADLPPLSEQSFQVAFGPGKKPKAAGTPMEYERLLNGPYNLITNGNFERGSGAPEAFLRPALGGVLGVAASFSTEARFGRRALELTVSSNTAAEWVGWRSQPIAVKPGASYLLSGWLKARALKGDATIYAHFHDAAGALCKSGAMVSTSPGVSSDSEWVNSTGFLTAPPDAATIEVHLTMNTFGTLRHDGLLLCEVVEGVIRNVHSAAGEALPAGQALQVWEVNPLRKVFPDTPPQASARRVAVELARNEYEPFQLALRGGDSLSPAQRAKSYGDRLSPPRSGEPSDRSLMRPPTPQRVTVEVSPLKNAAGNALPAVKVERVGFVPIDHPSGYFTTDVPDWCRKLPRGGGATDGWAGWWPDPLAPATAFSLSTNQTQPLWFTVRAPKDAPPGEYRAKITLRADGAAPLILPLTVRVLPFTLPDRTRLQVIFDFRSGPGGWYGPAPDSRAEREKWLRFMAAHRLGVNEIEPPPQFSYKDGQVTMDAREFDETARLCFDELGMSACYTPSFFYMFGWAYPPKQLFGLEPFTAEWNSALQQACRLFAAHLREKGWQDRFIYYISDEPHFQHAFVVEQMKKLCALIHEAAPALPIYSSTWRHCPAWDGSLDLWGIGQFGCFPVAEMERVRQSGKRLWFTCDGQMATDTPYLATERLLPYYCRKYGVAGFEFWGLSWWTYDPWRVGWHTFIRQSDEGKVHYWVRYPDGDGFLAYPGKPVGVDGPVSTIRLEQVREGLEDFEAMALLAGAAEKARKAGRSVAAAERALALADELVTIPNAGGLRSTEILPDPERLPTARRAVNAALIQLLPETASPP